MKSKLDSNSPLNELLLKLDNNINQLQSKNAEIIPQNQSNPDNPNEMPMCSKTPSPTTQELARCQELLSDEYVQNQVNWTLEDAGWKEEKKYSQPAGAIYARPWPENHNLNAIKVVLDFRCSVNDILSLLHDNMIERHKDWNDTFLEGRIVEQITPDCNVQYWRYRKLGITDRDFLVTRRKITQKDGSIILIDKSVEHPDCPPIKNAIRCFLPVNLRILKPKSDQTVTFTYMNYTDLKGKIPHWLVNIGNPSTSWEEIMGIKDICEHLRAAQAAEKLLAKWKNK